MGTLLSPNFFYNTSRGTQVDRPFLLHWLVRSRGSLGQVRIGKAQQRLVTPEVMLSTGVMRVGDKGHSPELLSRYLHLWNYHAEQGWTLLARQVTTLSTED